MITGTRRQCARIRAEMREEGTSRENETSACDLASRDLVLNSSRCETRRVRNRRKRARSGHSTYQPTRNDTLKPQVAHFRLAVLRHTPMKDKRRAPQSGPLTNIQDQQERKKSYWKFRKLTKKKRLKFCLQNEFASSSLPPRPHPLPQPLSHRCRTSPPLPHLAAAAIP